MAFEKYRSFRLETGLYLIEPVGGRTYQARARVEGQWRYVGTETADIKAAEQFAVRWFRHLHAGSEGHETVQQAADAYFKSIRDPGKRAYHSTTFKATKDYWSPGMGRPGVMVTEIDTPKLLAFVKWRQDQSPRGRSQNARITANTMHKDLVTLRQVLKYAVARGAIPRVPDFPGAHIIGSIERNPLPWLAPDEWKRLLKVADERIANAPNPRTERQRRELKDFLLFMHATAMRVDEAYGLQVRDVTVAYSEMVDPPADVELPKVFTSVVEAFTDGNRVARGKWVLQGVSMPYLKIQVRTSKTGARVCHSRVGIFATFERLSAGKEPTDPLFRERHRDGFRELLTAAKLRTNAHGLPRNAKCLRPTAISHWLLDKPTIPLSWLAANSGTSIVMLQDFYVRRLGLALDGSAWL